MASLRVSGRDSVADAGGRERVESPDWAPLRLALPQMTSWSLEGDWLC